MNYDAEIPSTEVLDALVTGLRHLLASEGWKVYCGVVEKQQTARLDGIVLTPLPGLDAALEQEYKKGEIAGMRMALQLPQALLDDAEESLKHLREAAASQPEGEPE